MSAQTSGGSLVVAKMDTTISESTQPHKKTRFLHLPAEIRNKVYMAMDLPFEKHFRVVRKKIMQPKRADRTANTVDTDGRKVIGTRL